MIDLWAHRILFTTPLRLTPYSAWHEHIPFAMFLVDILRPNIIVELGTYYGDSYCAFCQAVKELGLKTRCYAVDTWKGDPQTGFYGSEVLEDLRNHHDPLYGSFSRLIQSTFDEALEHFLDGSIDLLHIDGYHKYEVIKHDFESWFSKMSSHGVILFHDINVREGDFGAWKLWEELKAKFPYFEFLHGHGLGVLGVGNNQSKISWLYELTEEEISKIRNFFFEFGYKIALKNALNQKEKLLLNLNETLNQRDSKISELTNIIIEKEKIIQKFKEELHRREDTLIERDRRIESLEISFKEKEIEIENLRSEFIQINSQIRDKQHLIDNLEVDLKEKEAYITNLESRIREIEIENESSKSASLFKDSQIKDLESEVLQKKSQIEALEVGLKEKEAYIANLESQLKEREVDIEKLRLELIQKDSLARERELTLNRIYHSYGLKGLVICNKLIDTIFPFNTKRRLFARLILNLLKYPRVFFSNIKIKNIKYFFKYLKTVETEIIFSRFDSLFLRGEILAFLDKYILEPGVLEIAGWAISSYGIEKVEIYLDKESQLLGEASYGALRNDVHSVYPFIKDSAHSGFSFVYHFKDPLPEGRHEVLVKIISKNKNTLELKQYFDTIDPYQNYLKLITPQEETIQWMKDISHNFVLKPLINISIIVKKESFQFLQRSLDSIISQVYPFWKGIIFCEEELLNKISINTNYNNITICSISELNNQLLSEECDYICFINSGDVLQPHSLFEMVKKINMEKDAEIIYSDEDRFIKGERENPFFKPDWSPETLLSMNYIGQFFLLKKDLLKLVGGLRYDFKSGAMYDLLLRATERSKRVIHIPLILYTKGFEIEDPDQIYKKILEECLIRRRIKGKVIPLEKRGIYRIKREIIGNPKVSIIILTAYKNPDLFKNCIKSVIEKSTYKNYEIVIVDHTNGKLPRELIKQLIPIEKLIIIEYKGEFNFSKMNNCAAQRASGDFLILLNDDVEVISSDWIESLLEFGQQEDLGVVGAKLLYKNDTIQHAGMFLVDYGGGARHAFRHFSNEDYGYFNFLKIARNVSAVTFACVMISKKVYFALNGLDETLRIECNDVDFCLRAIYSGYRVVWTPFAELYHNELSSRREINIINDQEHFWKKWKKVIKKGDPYYNLNLTLDSDNYTINQRLILTTHYSPNIKSE